jgi:ribosomal protein L19E
MTDQEIARALESLIREDAKRPSAEQVRELIEAGVIDEEGRALIGRWNNSKRKQKPGQQNGPGAAPSARKGAGA